jgi:hypothetical protein
MQALALQIGRRRGGHCLPAGSLLWVGSVPNEVQYPIYVREYRHGFDFFQAV